ncbi:hypothetical protein Shyhy01_72670 [Streptomyces hygroscopicus subsp. hygroscopicus]|uniref:hypothetical protein n=1 Tax=Streptomyces sp. KHY 26 TaxID=3097359 RepID=UPI0024A55E8E|nr:hypothetical protein [Streptomyces hygroscopicus]GLX54318.1 hypothetical protein Shyhy01_72670 [Streptomyces hygroscopicus subsp. hygroscopicus]
MSAEWYVLIEEDRQGRKRVQGVEFELHDWKLAAAHRVRGDEARVAAVAEDAALHYMPMSLARHAKPGDQEARHAFLAQDGSWVVLLGLRGYQCHIRVTTARLMHVREEKETPPKSLKEMLRSAWEGPPPPVGPWSPPAED